MQDGGYTLGWGVVVFATTAMLAPSLAALSAMALPIPRDPPVMNSVLSRNKGLVEGTRRNSSLVDIAATQL